MSYENYEEVSATEAKDNLALLKSYVDMDNIAIEANIDQEELDKIGLRVLHGYNEDLKSCQEWLDDVRKVENLASLVASKKNQPLPNSANIKFPLITKAVYEFSSRTYPEIIKDGKLVKGRVVGIELDVNKTAQAERVADYMNFQLLLEQEDWEMELDKLLNSLGLIGFLCKKTYYDPLRRLIKSELCDYKDLIINSDIKSLDDARRISHVIHLRLNDLIEHKNAKLFCEEPVNCLIEELCEEQLDPKIDVIEQHTFVDLDGDDYAEPYIVTIVKSSGKVLRIAPRFTKDNIVSEKGKLKYIDATQLFTDYHFLVSPKGKFQSVGFGILMLHLNETINTVLNQLIDAGQLANLQGGFKDSRLKNMGSGNTNHDPGEWKTVKAMAGMTLKDGMMPIQYKEPSSVLFKLLELLIQTGKDLSSSTEVMTGATSADNAKTGAVQALQAQSLKVFTSIQRRIYRSLTTEFKKIYHLDSQFLDPKKYYQVIDQPKVVFKDDFDLKSVHIVPVADPNLSSDMQRASRNQILLAAQQLPGANKIELTKLVLANSDLNVPLEQLMLSDQQINQPSPDMIKIQAEIQSWSDDKKLKAEELTIRQFEAKVEFYKVQCQCLELKAKAMLEMAQAQAQQDNGKFQEHELQLKILETQFNSMKDAAEFMQNGQMHNNEMDMRQQELDQQGQQQDAQQQPAPQDPAG